MEIRNDINAKFICLVTLTKDADVFKIKYSIDNKEGYLTLSNKATYAIYLGTFNTFFIEDNINLNVKIVKKSKKYTKFYQEFKLVTLPEEIIPYGKENLYDDIVDINGETIYTMAKRIKNIALNYAENKDKQLLEDIIYGLDYLTNNYYTGDTNYSGNWWPYEIGIPRAISETLFLIYNDIDIDLTFKYLNIINFYTPDALYIFYRRNWPNQKYEVATYANLGDNIYVSILKAIMFEDKKTIKYLFGLVANCLAYTKKGDGFYKDGSFIQHDNVPYNMSYGEVLLKSMTKLLTIFKLIKFNINIYLTRLTTILQESYEPFLYNRYAFESTRGRAVSRKVQDSRYSYNTIMKSLLSLDELSDDKYFTELLSNLSHNRYAEEAKAFNYIDRYIYKNNYYALSFNNNSRYTINYECINGENLLGDYSSNGTVDYYFNNRDKQNIININPYYRIGSTNSLVREEANIVYNNNLSIGVSMDNLLNVYFKNNTYYQGNFSRFVLPNSVVFVGTKISGKDLVHTIYDDPSLVYDTKVARTGNLLIKVEGARLLGYTEQRSYSELNQKESTDLITINSRRLVLTKMKDYKYQVYPIYRGRLDDYELIKEDNYHILKYKDYLYINSFTKNELEYDNIVLRGKCSLIIKYLEDKVVVNIATGSRNRKDIYLKISGYSCDSLINNFTTIKDELEHQLIYRRNDEEV